MKHDINMAMPACGAVSPFSSDGFRALGVRHVAYIKPVTLLGRTGFAVHGADGTPLTIEDTETAAARFIFEQNLEPVRAH